MESKSLKNYQHLLFWLILIGGILARWYKFWEIPFTNDELSALNRLQFSSFPEMIKHAVYTDGHPAFVQSFLYCYTKIFSTQQWVVKLPFLIMGTLALPLYFFAAKKISSVQTALFVMGSLAFLQFPIAYTQTIRPYSSGLFFSSLTVFAWIYFGQAQTFSLKIKFGFLLAIGIFFSCSNHYFNFFQCILLVPASIFLFKEARNFSFYLPWILAAILYVPQWSIFFHHVHVGSPGWLPIPTANSLVHHIAYCFQFSRLSLIWAMIPVLALLSNRKKFNSNQWIYLLLFITPIAITFVYSIYRAPVFQDSIFIFSLFFLFLFLGDILSVLTIKPEIKLIWIAVFCLINIFQLLIKRDHYHQFYNQGYKSLVKSTYTFQNKSNSIPTIVYGFEPYFFNYYKQYFLQKNINKILFLREIPKTGFEIERKLNSPEKIIIAKAIDGPCEPWIELQLHYPYVYKDCHFGSEVLLFSKVKMDSNKLVSLKIQKTLYKTETGPKKSKLEWEPALNLKVPNNLITRTARFVLTLELDSVNKNNPQSFPNVSAELRISGSKRELRYCNTQSSSVEKGKLILLAVTDGFHFEWNNSDFIDCHAYVVNHAFAHLNIHNFKLEIISGNPEVYSLVNDFER